MGSSSKQPATSTVTDAHTPVVNMGVAVFVCQHNHDGMVASSHNAATAALLRCLARIT